jgi:hypothetical protein
MDAIFRQENGDPVVESQSEPMSLTDQIRKILHIDLDSF